MSKFIQVFYTACLLAFSANFAFAFQDSKKPIEVKTEKDAITKKNASDKKKKDKPKFKKYEDVITAKADTKKGIFITHEIGNKLYYEFNPSHFGKEFLWLVQIAKAEQAGLIGMEIKRLVVKFERLGDHILLRNVSHDIRAKSGSTEYTAVKAANLEGIIAALKIETFGVEKTPVVEMTSVFKGDIAELSPKRRLNASAIDKNRVFVTSVKTFERNIETRVLATFRLKPPSKGQFSMGDHATVELHHSMVVLPEKPMRPRYRDRRVGFFFGDYVDFSSKENVAKKVSYIQRWRLEKKDPSAAVSEPQKPIVYYVGRGTPKKWQKYVLEGIKMWQPAFEKAGFKNAIVGKLAPTVKEDPNWDAENAQISTVRWVATESRNATGPRVHDPRTGEILEADVRMFHNVISLLQDLYFVQAGASDPRAAKLPLPDEVIGELLRYVVAHEVGHTLGLLHNFIGNNAYPVESYRDQNFVNRYGMSSSIMDYSRFNYIAQPGDGVAYIPNKVGPYDDFAIEWGYKEFDNSRPVSADKPFLNALAAKQIDNPLFRFGGGQRDPRSQTEDIGDDAIKATAYGLKNLERIAENLVSATAENGKDFSRLESTYTMLVNQMSTELKHVSTYIGGIEEDLLVSGLSRSDTFRPTPVRKQKEALQFLLKHGFHTKEFLLRPDIIQRIGIREVVRKISGSQKSLMLKILRDSVVSRINNMEAGGYQVYRAVDIFDEMRTGVFSEIYEKGEAPNIFRRNLHHATIDHLIASMVPNEKISNDFRALCLDMLVKLRSDLIRAAAQSKNQLEKIHYSSLAQKIAKAMQK